MSWYQRLTNVFRADKLSAELEDELAFHIAERTDDLIAAGMTPEEARRTALRSFGNYTSQKERTRDMDIARWLEELVRDLRHGVRQLRLNPGFTTVAVLSLALGIGANSAIFQLINALRLRSLPVPEAAQLVAVGAAPDFYTSGRYEARNRAFTYAQFEQIVAQQEAFSGLMAFGTMRFNLSRSGETRYAEGLYVTPNFLEQLRVAPLLGSGFPANAALDDCSQAGAVLDYAFWQREFGGDPSAVGRTISLNGRSFPILGVTPATFFGVEAGRRFDVAIPICADVMLAKDGKGRLVDKSAWWLTPIGRLKPGWTVERASAHLRNISPVVFRETVPESYRTDAVKSYLDNKLQAVPASAGVSQLRRQFGGPLWILFGLTGLVLLIACANLANLLLARASVRDREVALRQAIGSSRLRVLAQFMSESLLLAAFGALLGALVAQLLSRSLVLFLSSGETSLYIPLGVDWRVFGFTALLAVLTCLLFGLAPAIRATKTAPADALRGGRGTAAAVGRQGLRRGLVVAQIALSFVLLVGALLFGQSLRNLLSTDTGFVSEGVLVASINGNRPDLEPARRLTMFRQLEERINALPGVVSAATVEYSPFSGNGWNMSVHADDDENTTGGSLTWFNRVSPGYFRTMKTTLLAGRDFGPHDDRSAPQVAIINEKFARDLFGENDPIGRTFRSEASAGEGDPVYQVVGVAANTKYSELGEAQRRIAFLPVAQDENTGDQLSMMIRARGPFSSVMAGVRQQMEAVDGSLLVEFQVLSSQMAESVLRDRLMAHLTGAFGLLAALLSTLGLYGVMSYMVARRRSEIGVRLALGAESSDVVGMVLGEAGRLLLVGLAVGLAGSIVLSRFAESLLFGLKPNDGATLALACALLGATALAASWLPARRAARLEPSVVLRNE